MWSFLPKNASFKAKKHKVHLNIPILVTFLHLFLPKVQFFLRSRIARSRRNLNSGLECPTRSSKTLLVRRGAVVCLEAQKTLFNALGGFPLWQNIMILSALACSEVAISFMKSDQHLYPASGHFSNQILGRPCLCWCMYVPCMVYPCCTFTSCE